MISARSADRLDRIAGEINALSGGKAVPVAADAGVAADLGRLVEAAHDHFGRVHIVFNNAAAGVVYAKDGGLWANTDEVWKTAFDVNVLATWRLAELTTQDMAAHGKGSIISVQSCGGFTPIPPAVAYGVSKAALAFLTRSLAKALAPAYKGNALCVGSMSPDGKEAEIHKGLGPGRTQCDQALRCRGRSGRGCRPIGERRVELHDGKHHLRRRRQSRDDFLTKRAKR